MFGNAESFNVGRSSREAYDPDRDMGLGSSKTGDGFLDLCPLDGLLRELVGVVSSELVDDLDKLGIKLVAVEAAAAAATTLTSGFGSLKRVCSTEGDRDHCWAG